METMRAARHDQVGRIECEDAPIPSPNEGEVLVRIDMAAICGSDLHVVYDGLSHMSLPCPHGFPGHEGVGEVVESKNPLLKPGAKVLLCPAGPFSRTFAAYIALPADQCVVLPAYAGPAEHLLMAQQFGTTIFALRQMPADVVGKTVMVMGQGSAGNFFAYNLKRAGAAKVIVSDKSEARLATARDFGADVALKAERASVLEAVREHTDGEGVHFLVEAVGHADSFLEAVDYVRPGGQMLWFGLPDTEKPIPFNFRDYFRKKLRSYSTYGTQQEGDRVSFKLALHLIATRQVDVTRMITHRLPIDQIGKAMKIALDRSDNARKVAVTF